MKKKARIVAVAVAVIAALLSFAATAFAATPCLGAYYEPEMPKKLRPTK